MNVVYTVTAVKPDAWYFRIFLSPILMIVIRLLYNFFFQIICLLHDILKYIVDVTLNYVMGTN